MKPMEASDSPRPALLAASDALDAAIDAAVAGEPTHPSGTTFVPADLELRDVPRPYVVVGGGTHN